MLLFNRNDNLDPSDQDLVGSVPKRRQGLSARATYVFNSKYIAEFNMGYNGSENYAVGKKMGFFPAYAIGWVASAEPFFKPLLKHISLLKIRVTTGTVGNDAINNRFAYLTRVVDTGGSYTFGIGAAYGSGKGIDISYYGNPNASWEKAQKSDLGVEIACLRGIRINADLFYERRTQIWDQLSRIPQIYGYTSGRNSIAPYGNIGEAENRGFDGSLEYFKKINKKLTIQFKGTFLWSENKILQNGAVTPKYAYQSRIGQPINNNYGLIALGYFKSQEDVNDSPIQGWGQTAPGDIKYKDLNGDGRVDSFDETFIGNPPGLPKISCGAGGSITYLNIDFSFLFSCSAQTSFMPRPKGFTEVDQGNLYQIMADSHWTAENNGADATFPRLAVGPQYNNYQPSTFWLKDGSFVRLKQVEIGYSLNSRFLKQSRIFQGFRIYVTGLNLLTFSKFKWWDPESQSNNGVYYPVQKFVNFGFNAHF
ncbi:MAG: hypothetical protein CRN43_12815 [Candidatus Nephrothrix sp. EaCA]|nr:MAG: hypothetical protein CRN43_12815 [Candidatus Nephrothrix sp. EaCA]